MDYQDVKTAKDKLEKAIDNKKFPKLVKWHKQDDSSEKIRKGSDSKDRKKRVIEKKHLVNKLNYLNFQDKTININFKHKKYNSFISFQAKPLPCIGDKLDCLWTKKLQTNNPLNSFEFHNFVVSDGRKRLVVRPELIDINAIGVCFKLPERCYEAVTQKVIRHSCKSLKIQLIQNSAVFHGTLMGFNATSFSVKIKSTPPQTFQWINTESPINLIFFDGNETLYSGECRIRKQTNGDKTRSFIVEPFSQQIQRFAPKEFRSMRQKVVPSPNAVFNHPLTGKTVDFKIIDLAGAGFSVEEEMENRLLLPGMIIRSITINFANTCKIKCKAQVIYRQLSDNGQNGDIVKCGIAILDITPQDHVTLSSILHQANDRNSYVCNRVNMDALWDFFFETDFIYPSKYAFIKANKDQIKRTYEKLYTQSPSIGRHFICQEKGVIMGHMSMLRYYENSWMIHHHAARKSAMVKAGLSVLEQIGRFTYESHLLYSIHMDFLFCYFRPENRFPNYVFGGIAKNIDNPKRCSIDTFAYLHYQKAPIMRQGIKEVWTLTKTQPEDFNSLEEFYDIESGGLMFQAQDMKAEKVSGNGLTKEYHKLGFQKERHIISLKKYDMLKAVIIVNISDIGLNLSDLTNCIKVFVVDQDDVSKDILNHTLSLILAKFKKNEIPVLLYPASYAKNQSIPYEKLYNLWILDMQFSDNYFRQLKRLLRFHK